MEIKKKYKFVQNKSVSMARYIGLTEEAGFYQGMVYKYGKVTPIEENDNVTTTI